MTTRPPDRKKRLDELVGRRTGRVRTHTGTSAPAIKRRRQLEDRGVGSTARTGTVRHGGGKVSSGARKTYESWFGDGTGVTATTPLQATKSTFDTLFNKYSQELDQQVKDEQATRTAYAAQVLDQQVDPEAALSNKGVQLAPSMDKQYLNSTIAKLGSAIPAGLLNVAQRGKEAEEAGAGFGEQFLGAFSDFGEGIGKAFKGESYTGPGDVYEELKNNSDMWGFQGARKLEEEVPFVEQQLARGIGGLGEWYLHPVGRAVGLGKAGVVDGVAANPASMRQHIRRMAERWGDDWENHVVTGGVKSSGGHRWQPSRDAVVDNFEKHTMTALEAAEIQINGGGSKGRYQVWDPDMSAGLVGAHGSESLMVATTSHFTDRVKRVIDGIKSGNKLSGPALEHWAYNSPDFTDFLSDLSDDLINQGVLSPSHSMDDLANHLSTADIRNMQKLEQALIDRKYTPYITQAANDIAREFKNSYYNTPGIRIGNNIIPVKAIGKAYAAVGDKAFGNVSKNFNVNSVFPGSLSVETTRARAYGVKASEDFEAEVRERARPFTDQQGIDITHAIENNGIHLLDPDSQVAAQWIKDQLQWMHNEEFIWGARGRKRDSPPGIDSSTTPYDPNYVFVHNKGGAKGDRTRWKDKRKRVIHKNARDKNGEGAGAYKTANAKADKLRPVENAFESLRQRRIKHNRDMIRAKFLTDMVDNFGISSKINPAHEGYAATQRGLEEVSFQRLPEATRVLLEKTGERIYLPREMARMIDTFEDITKWHSGIQGRIGRTFAAAMRIIKKGMTLPWPGFHVKNMIGDVFMGLLDHVLPVDYARVIQKGLASLRGNNSMFKILKDNPGLDIGFRQMWAKYQSEANSGFISAELADTGGNRFNLPRRAVSTANKVAIDVSGFREDAGRFTHYVTAYRQEARALYKAGERDLARIQKKASSAALWRVNNYKFDYNALMLWEKKAKTMYFPFYTFMRKAAPTLIQAMYQDPRWIQAWTRYMYQRPEGDQKMSDEFDGFRVPDEIRETGYAMIGGQAEEPWYVTNDILPTSVLNSMDTTNAHEFFNSMLSQTALPFQVAIEQGTGRQAFLDMPLKDQSFPEYMFSKVPGVREFDSLMNSTDSWGERLLHGRVGAGLPIRQIGEDQQLQSLQEWQDKMIDDPLYQINHKQDLYYISTKDSPTGKSSVFSVQNKSILDSEGNATVEAQFYTPEEAVSYVKNHLPEGYKKIPMTMDIDNQGNPYPRPVKD